MENQILEAISHIRKISKKKTIDRILAQINNSAATNWDLESGKLCLNEMTAKGIIKYLRSRKILKKLVKSLKEKRIG